MDDKKTVETAAAADAAKEPAEAEAPATTTLNRDMPYRLTEDLGEKDWGPQFCR